MAEDIRETGPVGLKGLNRQNVSEYSLEDQWKLANAMARTPGAYTPPAEEEIGWEASQAGYGASQYDEGITSASQLDDINDIRYNEQGWGDVLANGVTKMLGTAASTFLSSLVGLPYGAVEAATQGRWSALWDNEITQGLGEFDNWLENNFTNYQSEKQQQEEWYQKLGNMNWWADNVIKNIGFTLGAATSGTVASGGLGLLGKAFSLVNNVSKGVKTTNAILSSLFSATGEGMIEARQGVEDRNKLEIEKLNRALAPEYDALNEQEELANQDYEFTGDYATYSERLKNIIAQREVLDQRKEAGIQQIQETGLEMGNKILLGNQVLLTLGNFIQFSKLFNSGFDTARHAVETAAKHANPILTTATRVSNKLADGYAVSSKWPGRIVAATKGLFTEGSEEMNQQWIQNTAGLSSNQEDANDYWRAKLDPESYNDTTKGLYALGKAISQGFNDSWGDFDQWEQFVIGGMTGMAGSYAPTKIFNQDKTKSRWNPMRYGEWGGGAIKEVRDFNEEYNKYKENIDDLNRILADGDFNERILDTVGHTFNEKRKEEAALADDKKDWIDADTKQTVMDIQAFARAGKLDDLRTIYAEMGKDLSDEDIEGIINRTTYKVSQEQDKKNHFAEWDKLIEAAETPEEKAALEADKAADTYEGKSYYGGAFVDEDRNVKYTYDQIRQKVRDNSAEMQRKLDSYLESAKFVQEETRGQLSKDQEDNLTYLHNMGKESIHRMYDIIKNERKNMPKKFLFKTDKSPEELTQQYATSDLVFTQDEHTQEGYVEADTSMMTDTAFADFFQEEIMRGGNINPAFAETAEEKALREEEEKTLPEEERKKKAMERLSKKWEETVAKHKKDVDEQRSLNINNLVNYFVDNYQKEHPEASVQEALNAYKEVWENLVDAGELYNQSGEYFATLKDYMNHPEKILKDKAKEEEKVKKAEGEKKAKKDFAGKTAKEMNQEIANGDLTPEEVDDFAGADLDDITDDDLKQAQQQAQESKKIREKAAKTKKHLQESLGDDATPEEIADVNLAMEMVDNAALDAEDADSFDRLSPHLSTLPFDAVDGMSDTEIDETTDRIQSLLDTAFAGVKEDEKTISDIPDDAVTTVTPKRWDEKETGRDSVSKVDTTVVTPTVKTEKKKDVPVSNTLDRKEADKVSKAIEKIYEKREDDGTFRTCTTRYPYGTSEGAYYEIAKRQYGENSPEYKRAKALWDFMNSEDAFDRVENSSVDHLKEEQPLMLMVKYLPEVFGKPYEDAIKEHSEEEMAQAMAIIMIDDKGGVIGDLPLAQYEPTYKNGNPLPDVKTLMALQDGAFKFFADDYKRNHQNEVMLNGTLNKDNDKVTYVRNNKPFSVKIKKVIKGVVPYNKKGVFNYLNDVFGSVPFELGVRTKLGKVDAIATKRGVISKKSGIVAPEVGTVGNPYILMPTPSGERIACPIYMDPFDATSHRGTEFYKALNNVVYSLLNTAKIKDENKKKAQFQKHMSELEGLLQVTNIKGKSVIKVTGREITMQLANATNPDTEYILTVPNTGNLANDVAALVEKMSGFKFNVSLEYINQRIEVGSDELGKKTYDYNKLIGEIADINLEKDTTHTVNGRVLISFPTLEFSTKKKRRTIPVTGTMNETINGRNIEFDISSEDITAKDAITGEIIDDDEAVNLRRAQIRVVKLGSKAGDFIQINVKGGTRRYDVKNNKFVAEKKETKPATPTLPEAVEEQDSLDSITGVSPTQVTPIGFGVPKAKPQNTTPSTEEAIKNFRNKMDDLYKIFANKYPESTSREKYSKKTWDSIVEKLEKFTSEDLKAVYADGWTSYPSIDKAFYDSGNPNWWTYKEDYFGDKAGDIMGALKELVAAKESTNIVTQASPVVKKTIEQIEDEVRKASIVSQRNQETWDAIPNELKLKMVNEGAPLYFYYNSKRMTVSWSNKSQLKEELKNAKMAAKTGKFRVEEAPKPMQKDSMTIEREKEREARQWLAKNLPTLSSEERTQFVDKLSRVGDDASKWWGSYRNGVVQIKNNAPMGTVYHEAFHYVMDMILSDEERAQVLDIAKEAYGLDNNFAAEERLANDFRRYAIDENATGITGKIKRWIRKIVDKITRYNRISNPTVNQLFWKINNGEMASKATAAESFEDNQQRVLREIRNVQSEKHAWKNLDAQTKKNLQEYSGITEEKYNQMSLEEKEQYVRCRG